MKFKTKINIFVFSVLALLSLSIMVTGHFMISQVIYELYSKQFSRELENINHEVTQAYQVLESAGVLGIEDYVVAGKKDLLSKLGSYKFGETGFIYVLNENEDILLEPEDSAVKLFKAQYALHNNKANETRKSTDQNLIQKFSYSTENDTYFSVFTKSPVWNWVIVINISETEIFSLREKYQIYVGIISFLIFLFVLAISIRNINLVRLRIDLILNYLQRMGSGEHSLRIPTIGKDDIADIGTEINLMITQIDQEINQRKETENKLKLAKENAEIANHAKTAFLSQMSHELRTPMNAILGFGQLLMMEDEELGESQKESVNEILIAARYLLVLINEILDLAKIENGKVDIDMEDVELDVLIRQCLNLIRIPAKARSLFVVNQINDKEHIVKADSSRLKQVLVNLLSNAVKYNRNSGRITIDSEIIGSHQIRILVSDTGEGLTEEQIKKLFVLFERLDATADIEGTGIGLVIAKNLVELMGGSIGVESTPGKGSTFWVELFLSDT